MDQPLQAGIADLRHRPGTRRPFRLDLPIAGLVTSAARVPDGALVEVDLELEAQGDEVMVTGEVRAPWEGACRRCLEPARGVAVVPVQEVFVPEADEGETYPTSGDRIDLEPLVREAVLPSLPLAPLCSQTCEGPVPEAWVGEHGEAGGDPGDDEGADRGATRRDPRWAALDALRDPSA